MTDASAVSDVGNDDATPGKRDSLEIGREEARQTLDHQIRTLDDIDTKASKILRLNVALLSILLMGTSVLTKSSQYGAAELLTPLSLVGVGSLLVSTAFAGLTYTSSEYQTGLGHHDLRTMLASEYEDEQLQRVLVASYAEWIEFNDDTNVRNEPLITLTIVWTVYAVTFLTLGVLDVLLGSLPGYVILFTIASLLIFTLATDVANQISRWSDVVGQSGSGFVQEMQELGKRLSNRRDNDRP